MKRNSACPKCHNRTNRLMQASSPFYTCPASDPLCVFYVPVASASTPDTPQHGADALGYATLGYTARRDGYAPHPNGPEADFIADAKRLNCPACGGSGHIDDTPQHGGDAVANAYADALHRIGDYAHHHSTGPAVPDALWEVRSMAYEVLTTDQETR